MRVCYRLSAAKVASLTEAGRHADGDNLYLRISRDGHKTWGFRYRRHGRERMAGLGPVHRVSLAEARAAAEAMGKLLAQGLDPLVERDKARAAERAAQVRLMTFRDAATRYIADREGTWSNEQHRKDFINSLDRYVFPVIGSLSVAEIDTALVLKVLEQGNFWRAKPTTADR